MIGVLISLLLVILIFGLIWFALSKLPLPPPFVAVAQVILIVILVLVLLNVLTGLPGFTWRPILR